MVNSYPLWKYILILFILVIGIVYAIPNIYRECPVIYITQNVNNNKNLDNNLLCNIKQILHDENIPNKSVILESNKISVWCFCKYDQVRVYEKLSNILSNQYLISFNTVSTMPYWLSVIHARPIKLGLDLCGGIYLSMFVDMDVVLNKFRDQYIDTIEFILHDKIIPYIKISKVANYGIEINFRESDDRKQAILSLRKDNHDIILRPVENNFLKVLFSENYLFRVYEDAVKQNSIILRHRLLQLGIFEPFVQCYGIERIIIELPGMQDIEKIKQLIGTTVNLEFRLVNTTINEFEINNNFIPDDSELKLSDTGYLVPLYKKVILSGNCIVSSNVSFDEYNRPQVNLVLDKAGSFIMSKFTKDNIGKMIATVFIEYQDSGKKDSKGHSILIKSEKVINIATIQSQVSNNFRIVGIDDINKARHLSMLLRTGALVAPVHIEEEKIIGPMLGKKNIIQGLTACILGMIISISFMILWYHFFGLIASAALIINLILMISIISLMPNVVLTMSSIAGIVLTLSVAVDANVLINERIKEEIKQGKPVQYAIYVGYYKAFTSIVDANITTIITAIILYLIGTEVIKGFAITTIVGVGTSMFTSILGTRAVVNLIYGRKNVNNLSI